MCVCLPYTDTDSRTTCRISVQHFFDFAFHSNIGQKFNVTPPPQIMHSETNKLALHFTLPCNIFYTILTLFSFCHPCIHPSLHLSLFLDELISLSLPLVWVTRPTQENLLTGFSCPSGLIGPQHPVRRDQYIIHSVKSHAHSLLLPSLQHFTFILLLFLTADRCRWAGWL